MWSRTACAVLLVLAVPSAPSPASADDDPQTWQWPRFRAWEYAATAALGAEALTVRFVLDWDEDPTWEGGILFDDWALDHLTVESEGAFDAWQIAGDVGFYGSLVWAVADPLTAGLVADWDVATQMLLLNAGAYAFYGAVLWTTQFFVRRARPMTELCETDPQEARRRQLICEPEERIRSFGGGHVGAATTTASLTCLHHGNLDLYGDAGDAIACGATVAAAGVTFVARTVQAKHFLTDNILGVLLGLVSGGLLPYALHYAHDELVLDEADAQTDGPRLLGVSVSPELDSRGVTVELSGTL